MMQRLGQTLGGMIQKVFGAASAGTFGSKAISVINDNQAVRFARNHPGGAKLALSSVLITGMIAREFLPLVPGVMDHIEQRSSHYMGGLGLESQLLLYTFSLLSEGMPKKPRELKERAIKSLVESDVGVALGVAGQKALPAFVIAASVGFVAREALPADPLWFAVREDIEDHLTLEISPYVPSIKSVGSVAKRIFCHPGVIAHKAELLWEKCFPEEEGYPYTGDDPWLIEPADRVGLYDDLPGYSESWSESTDDL